MQNNKYIHPFFIGLLILLIAHFFTLFNMRIKENAISEISGYAKYSLWKSGIWGKVNLKVKGTNLDTKRRKIENDYESKDDDDFGSSRMKREVNAIFSTVSETAIIPRFYRVFNVIAFLLIVWGIIIYLLQHSNMRKSNIHYISYGIIGLMLLQVFLHKYESGKINKVLKAEYIRAKNMYDVNLGFGFYLLMFGVLCLIYNLYFYSNKKITTNN
jgi:hypothetical protein